MTPLVIVLLVLAGVSVLTLIATVTGLIEWERREMPLDAQLRVALHGARRRLEVAQVRVAIKADGARLRRELEQELRELERGGAS